MLILTEVKKTTLRAFCSAADERYAVKPGVITNGEVLSLLDEIEALQGLIRVSAELTIKAIDIGVAHETRPA